MSSRPVQLKLEDLDMNGRPAKWAKFKADGCFESESKNRFGQRWSITAISTGVILVSAICWWFNGASLAPPLMMQRWFGPMNRALLWRYRLIIKVENSMKCTKERRSQLFHEKFRTLYIHGHSTYLLLIYFEFHLENVFLGIRELQYCTAVKRYHNRNRLLIKFRPIPDLKEPKSLVVEWMRKFS